MHFAALGKLEHGLEHRSGRDSVRVGLEAADDVVVQGTSLVVDQLQCRVLLAEGETVLHPEAFGGGIGFGQLRLDRVVPAVDRLPDPPLRTVDELEGHVGRVVSGGEDKEESCYIRLIRNWQIILCDGNLFSSFAFCDCQRKITIQS